MSEIKSIKSLRGLTRKVPVSLSGFETPISFNLLLPTKTGDKLDVEAQSKRIFKLFNGKDGANKKEATKEANRLTSELVYKYSDLSEKEFEIDGETYKIQSAAELEDIVLELELMDFFMSLSGDEETIQKMNRLAPKKAQ